MTLQIPAHGTRSTLRGRWLARSLALSASAALAMAIASPAAAAKPARGCTQDFVPMTQAEFKALSLSVGVPADFVESPEWAATWDAYNRNGDAYLCIKDLPNTPGHLDTWVFNVTDNTSNH